MSLFIHETFLYIIAALLKERYFNTLHEIFTSSYAIQSDGISRNSSLIDFSCFFGHSDSLQSVLKPEVNLYSPSAELMKISANRADIPFQELLQAEILIQLMSFVRQVRWFPSLIFYAECEEPLPFFIKAAQHKNFSKLAIITGINDVVSLRQQIEPLINRLNTSRELFFGASFDQLINLDKLDSMK